MTGERPKKDFGRKEFQYLGWSAIEKLPELKEKVKTWVNEKEGERGKELPPNNARNRLKEMLDQKKRSQEQVENGEDRER